MVRKMSQVHPCLTFLTLVLCATRVISGPKSKESKSNECDLSILGCVCSRDWKTVDCKPATPPLTALPDLIPLEVVKL
jgi:hypothetical protein